jgi:hypothetical protein
MALLFGMARTAIKSTYALDVETVRKLDQLAARWQVSKSEVLRRAIKTAASEDLPPPLKPLEAFRKLQQSLQLNKPQVEKWTREVRRERIASSAKLRWRKK